MVCGERGLLGASNAARRVLLGRRAGCDSSAPGGRAFSASAATPCPCALHDVLQRLRHADRHQIEFFAMTLVRIARQLTGTNLRPLRLSLVHPRGAASSALEAAFRCQISFGEFHDELVFASDAARLTVTGADPYLHDLLADRRPCACASAQDQLPPQRHGRDGVQPDTHSARFRLGTSLRCPRAPGQISSRCISGPATCLEEDDTSRRRFDGTGLPMPSTSRPPFRGIPRPAGRGEAFCRRSRAGRGLGVQMRGSLYLLDC